MKTAALASAQREPDKRQARRKKDGKGTKGAQIGRLGGGAACCRLSEGKHYAAKTRPPVRNFTANGLPHSKRALLDSGESRLSTNLLSGAGGGGTSWYAYEVQQLADGMQRIGTEDEYNAKLAFEPLAPESPELALMSSQLEDATWLVRSFRRQYLCKPAWPRKSQGRLRDIILALDWFFGPDPDEHIYNFENVAVSLNVEPNYWRKMILKMVGMTAPEMQTLLMRAKLWLREAHHKIGQRGPDLLPLPKL